jgi:RHS repeat-associated protein
LLSDSTYTYEYDGEGNRTKRTQIATGKVTQYVWDYRNRLTQVVFKDAAGNVVKSIRQSRRFAIEYTYDVADRRIAKKIDGVVQERYVYDEDNIALVFDGQGNQTHRYLHGTGVDQVLADERADGSVIWALADNQGTVRDLIDSNGVIVNHISYDSFGKVVSQTSNLDFRYGYTGREQDNETGLDYYRARYYDAALGRFISEDPIGFAAGDTNIYRYVGNSPTNAIDPSGNCDVPNNFDPIGEGLKILIVIGSGILYYGSEGLKGIGNLTKNWIEADPVPTPTNPLPFPNPRPVPIPNRDSDPNPTPHTGNNGLDLSPNPVLQSEASPSPTSAPSPTPIGDDRRDGAGKNGQHGRPAPPSLNDQLQQKKDDLAKLKAEQGSRKAKSKLEDQIQNLQKDIDRKEKGENHRQRHPGSNGGTKR